MPLDRDRDGVELTMPALAAFVPLARLQVAVVASVLDARVDEIDDLRLAIEELCLWALRRPRDTRGHLHLQIHWEDGLLDAECTLLADKHPLPADAERPDQLLDTLSMQILAALVDEHGVSDGTEPRAWFRKKRTSA